jgi:hypothetical protein
MTRTPGFVEIDLVGHEGGNSRGEFCFTLTVTDIATGWTENRTVINKAQVHVFAALTDVGNHFYPQQKLVSKIRDGAKITKRYDTARTPYARVTAHSEVKALPKRWLAKEHSSFNPAAVQRQIQALCDELLTLATAKGQPARKPQVSAPATRTFPDQATKQLSRTS